MRLDRSERYREVAARIDTHDLHTVCAEAGCPNQAECWEAGTAAFMILGDVCTRGCLFCGVERGDPAECVDLEEPTRVAEAARLMNLDYVTVTSVTRDDLTDGGASVFASTVEALHALIPTPKVEVLIPDYLGASLSAVVSSGPEVIAHNIEVIKRFTPTYRHKRFDYGISLEVLRAAKELDSRVITKSSLMLGLGESDGEIRDAMRDLAAVGVTILCIGQYLQPSPGHAPVVEYVTPERFDEYGDLGRSMGFGFVASAPLVRTSYRAAEHFAKCLIDASSEDEH